MSDRTSNEADRRFQTRSGSQRRVVIVGGGITGLAVANALLKVEPNVSIALLEKDARLGGSIGTERHGDFVVDRGADSWLAAKPSASALARSLGLGGELVGTIEKNRRVYVAWNHQLHPLPEGSVLGVPTRILPMIRTGLFGWRDKLRMGLEPFVPRRSFEGDADESIASFMTRRLGRAATDRLAAPLLGGIYAGDAYELSVRAALPQMVLAEKTYGSIVLAMRAQKKAARGKGASAFVSMRGGMGAFIDALEASLSNAVLRKGVGMGALSRLDAGDPRGRWVVETTAGDLLFADDVVLAVPSYVAASMTQAIDPELSRLLDGIPYASTAAVFFGYRRQDVAHPLDATGYIVPRVLGQNGLASTWVSSKWEGRAPAGFVLMRVFLGGAGRERILEQEDDALARTAREELAHRIGASAAPVFTKVFRFKRASPQLLLGHLVRMRNVREHLHRWPGLHAAGGGYDGVGIPSCIDQGQAVARAILVASRAEG